MMECLWQLHILNLKANITAFGYYGSLMYMMDNLGLNHIPVSPLLSLNEISAEYSI